MSNSKLVWVRASGLVGALALIGCGAEPRVVRAYDGRLVVERFVPPEAYASFLRGALAEETGDTKVALAEYTDAAEEDGRDPEIWSRIGDLECKRNPRDPHADSAFARAAKIDPSYAGMLAAKSRCALAQIGRASCRERVCQYV